MVRMMYVMLFFFHVDSFRLFLYTLAGFSIFFSVPVLHY